REARGGPWTLSLLSLPAAVLAGTAARAGHRRRGQRGSALAVLALRLGGSGGGGPAQGGPRRGLRWLARADCRRRRRRRQCRWHRRLRRRWLDGGAHRLRRPGGGRAGGAHG